MVAAILLVLGVILPQPGLSHRVGLLEVNHLQHDDGTARFSQVILWDWDDAAGRFIVRDWIACPKDPSALTVSPDGSCVLRIDAGTPSKPRALTIRAAMFRETWTQQDPEKVDAQAYPAGQATSYRETIFTKPPSPAERIQNHAQD